MPLSAEPEILRCTLTSSILQLKCLNQDLETLDFMDKPDTESSMCSVVFLIVFASIYDYEQLLLPLRHCICLELLTILKL